MSNEMSHVTLPPLGNSCLLYKSSPMALISVLCCLFVLGAGAVGSAEAGENGKILACYYLPSKRVPVSKIPADLCTHIIFAFGEMTTSGIQPVRNSDVTVYSDLIGLKQKNKDLKVLISLQNGFPSVIGGGVTTMNTFTKYAIQFLRKYGFDGVDFDWEFPDSTEKSSYMKFLSIFRQAITEETSEDSSPLLMSMALSNNANIANKGYDIPTINKYIDFATVMSYDFHVYSRGDNVTSYNSALFPPRGEWGMLTASGIISYYSKAGLAASKILMGMPTYGRTYNLTDPSNHGLHAPANAKGAGGPVIHQPGVYITQEVCMIEKTATGKVRDDTAKVPYLYQGSTWLTYDDVQSYTDKCTWAKTNQLGGMGVWALPLDDVSGICPGGPFPMISTLKNCLG